MLKKYLILTWAFLVMNLFLSVSAFAQTPNDNNNRFIINLKNTVAKVGTEPNRKINVKLKDGTKLKGYITEIKDDHFSVMDTKSGNMQSVQYSQVIEAKRDGLSKLAVALISAGVVFGGLVALTAAAMNSNDW